MEELSRAQLTSVEPLRRFTRAVLDPAENAALVQMRADLWTERLNDDAVGVLLADSIQRQRVRLRGWIEDGVAQGSWSRFRPMRSRPFCLHLRMASCCIGSSTQRASSGRISAPR